MSSGLLSPQSSCTTWPKTSYSNYTFHLMLSAPSEFLSSRLICDRRNLRDTYFKATTGKNMFMHLSDLGEITPWILSRCKISIQYNCTVHSNTSFRESVVDLGFCRHTNIYICSCWFKYGGIRFGTKMFCLSTHWRTWTLLLLLNVQTTRGQCQAAERSVFY